MTSLALGVLLLVFIAGVPLLRALQRRPQTPVLLARALGVGLRFFWVGMTAGLAIGVLSMFREGPRGGALAAPFLPFVAIAVGAVAFLGAFLVSANLDWIRLGRAARRRQPLLVRLVPVLTAALVAAALLLGLGPLLRQRGLAQAGSAQATAQELRELYLAHPEDQKLIGAISQNPAASEELIAEMARGGYAALYVLAGHPRLPIEIMTELARDDRIPLRRNVATNPALPEPLMGILLRDPEPEVRAALAANRAAGAEILADLASDRDAQVRRGVAANPRAAIETLEALARSPDPSIAASARRTLGRRAGEETGAVE